MESTKNLLGLISGFSKITGYKVSIKNVFLCTGTKSIMKYLRINPRTCVKVVCQTLHKPDLKSQIEVSRGSIHVHGLEDSVLLRR